MRDQAYEFYYKTPLEFCFTKCCICCYDKKKHYINDKIVDVKPAPNPSNIQWENLSYSKASLQIRNRISFLISFLLLCGALVTQVGLK